jgi:cytochrome c biogenesis protein CcmG, thiol:disulfide interchange protein DsbE
VTETTDSPADEPSATPRPRHTGRWIASSVGAVVVVLGVVLALNVGTDPTATTRQSALLGKAAPSFDLPTLGGTRVSQTSLTGKAVIVNFWNTWCIPCRQELPALKTFYENHAADPDFAMVGIVRDDSKSNVRSYVAAEQMHWIIAFDPGSRAALDFATRGQPETFAINADGQIVGFQWGPSNVAGLEAMLATARGQQ